MSTSAIDLRPSFGATRAGSYSLRGLMASEWTKLTTVRSTRWAIAVTFLLGLGVSALATGETHAHWATMSPGDRFGFDPTQTSLIGVVISQLVIGVLGVLAMSAEYSSGTIRATFSAAPKRLHVLGAKIAVFGAVAFVVSELTAFLSYFLGQAILSSPTPHTTLASPDALRQVLGSGLYLTVLALIGLSLGLIIRHTAGAISAFVGIILVLPLVIAALPSSVEQTFRKFTPAEIGNTMISMNANPFRFSPWLGFAVLCAYAVGLLAFGGYLLVHRDA